MQTAQIAQTSFATEYADNSEALDGIHPRRWHCTHNFIRSADYLAVGVNAIAKFDYDDSVACDEAKSVEFGM